ATRIAPPPMAAATPAWRRRASGTPFPTQAAMQRATAAGRSACSSCWQRFQVQGCADFGAGLREGAAGAGGGRALRQRHRDLLHDAAALDDIDAVGEVH